MEKKELKIIKETIEEFFKKTTFSVLSVSVNVLDFELKNILDNNEDKKNTISVSVKLKDPQVLIGEKGQTLFEIQKILKNILNKKFKKIFYLDLDINDYKKNKIDYIKKLTKQLSEEVCFYKTEKTLPPMSAFERRVVHEEMSFSKDIKTESKDTKDGRCVVLIPL